MPRPPLTALQRKQKRLAQNAARRERYKASGGKKSHGAPSSLRGKRRQSPAVAPAEAKPKPSPTPKPRRSPVRSTPRGLARRIEKAYYKLSKGESNVRVYLSDLRGELSDVPRKRLDSALRGLAGRGKGALYRLDVPWEITPARRAGTLYTRSGEPRHILYYGGKGS